MIHKVCTGVTTQMIIRMMMIIRGYTYHLKVWLTELDSHVHIYHLKIHFVEGQHTYHLKVKLEEA